LNAYGVQLFSCSFGLQTFNSYGVDNMTLYFIAI